MGTFPEIDIALPTYRRGTGRIVFHRFDIPENEWITRDGMRVTTPARTLLDLADLIPRPHLQRVFTEAEVLQHVDQAAIALILAAHPRGSRRQGAGGARRIERRRHSSRHGP